MEKIREKFIIIKDENSATFYAFWCVFLFYNKRRCAQLGN